MITPQPRNDGGWSQPHKAADYGFWCAECGNGRDRCYCGREFKVRYIDFTEKTAHDSLLLPNDAPVKVRILEKLGITPRAGESAHDAWCRAMAEENNVPDTRPMHPGLTDCILKSPGALRFMWVLA